MPSGPDRSESDCLCLYQVGSHFFSTRLDQIVCVHRGADCSASNFVSPSTHPGRTGEAMKESLSSSEDCRKGWLAQKRRRLTGKQPLEAPPQRSKRWRIGVLQRSPQSQTQYGPLNMAPISILSRPRPTQAPIEILGEDEDTVLLQSPRAPRAPGAYFWSAQRTYFRAPEHQQHTSSQRASDGHLGA